MGGAFRQRPGVNAEGIGIPDHPILSHPWRCVTAAQAIREGRRDGACLVSRDVSARNGIRGRGRLSAEPIDG